MLKRHICLVVLVLFVSFSYIASVDGKPAKDRPKEIEKEQNCKNLCGHCGCTGFYCGEECICECNNQNNEDMSCVTTMQENCEKLKLPFEVLIQGPSENRIVRSLLKTEADEHEVCLSESNANLKRRSTISIYQPDQIDQHIHELHQPKTATDGKTTLLSIVRPAARTVAVERDSNQIVSELDPKEADTVMIPKNRIGASLKRHIKPMAQRPIADRFSELQENERYANAPLIKRDVGDLFDDLESVQQSNGMQEMQMDDVLDEQLRGAVSEKRKTRMLELFEGARLGLAKLAEIDLGLGKWADIELELAKLGGLNLGLANLADLNLGLVKLADWNVGLFNLAEVELGLSRLLGANLGLDLSRLGDWNLGLIKFADIDLELIREKLGINAELLKSTFDLGLLKEKINALTDIDLGLVPLSLDFWRGPDGALLDFAALKSIFGVHAAEIAWNDILFGAPKILGVGAVGAV